MKVIREKMGVIQNLGLVDRVLRTILGWFLMGAAYVSLISPGQYLGGSATWEPYAMIGVFYILLTAIIGWDPFYSMIHTKSCDISDRNRCGTFPYEVKAAMGHTPEICELESEHSLESCHDRGVTKPRHKIWKITRGNWF